MKRTSGWSGLTIRLLLIASLILISPTVFADCEYDEANTWIECDEVKGYVVSSDKLKKLLDAYDLIDPLTDERDKLQWLLSEATKLRDEYRLQRDKTEAELVIVESKYLESSRAQAELQAELDASWSDLEVGFFAAGVGALALLAGVGVTVLYFKLQ